MKREAIKTRSTTPNLSQEARESLLRDALEIQHRFAAEPLLKTTGIGSLKAVGVDHLRQEADELSQRHARRE